MTYYSLPKTLDMTKICGMGPSSPIISKNDIRSLLAFASAKDFFINSVSHFKDLDSRHGKETLYNGRLLKKVPRVDNAYQVIVDCEVSNQTVDREKVVHMIEQVRQNTGELPREMSADASYFSKEAVKRLTALGVEAFIPPDKIKHTAPLSPAPCAGVFLKR